MNSEFSSELVSDVSKLHEVDQLLFVEILDRFRSSKEISFNVAIDYISRLYSIAFYDDLVAQSQREIAEKFADSIIKVISVSLTADENVQFLETVNKFKTAAKTAKSKKQILREKALPIDSPY